MNRYVYHLLLACMLGLCRGEPDDVPVTEDQARCICKPVMRLEWEPTSSICNNATFDWLLQTVLSQVTKQNEDISIQTSEIDQLTQDISNKDVSIQDLQNKLYGLEDQIYDLKNQNTKLQDELEDVNQHKATETSEIDHLTQDISNKDVSIQDLQNKLYGLEDQIYDLENQNTKLQDVLEDVNQHKAHLKPHPKDCADVQKYGFHYSGIYTIYPQGYPQGIEAFCDLNTDKGGWLVFQRRQDGSQRFDKLWDDYKLGFGTVAKEFWLGNDKIHQITQQRAYELRIDLTDFLGNKFYAKYDVFSVDGEEDKYTLHVNGYEGDAGDAMKTHNKIPFSTTDLDSDNSRSGNCAELYGSGGWWFDRCYDANLNGIYSDRHLYETIVWYQLHKDHEPMRHAEMKMRPKGF